MIKVSSGSIRSTVLAMDQTNISARNAALIGLEDMGDVWRDEVKANLSMRDHSLQSLADMDHPYARRHGAIQLHGDKPHLVHTHSGRLLGALTSGIIFGRSPKYRVALDTNKAEHAEYVVQGTRTMLPRDVIFDTAHDAKVRKDMMRAFVRVFGKRLKTKASLRFQITGGGVSGTAAAGIGQSRQAV